MKNVEYKIENAIEIVRKVQPMLQRGGINIALTGSTLFKGSSKKDFDFYLYPHEPKNQVTITSVRKILNIIGFEKIMFVKPSCSNEGRIVDVYSYDGYRVDIFLDSFIDDRQTSNPTEDEDVPF